MLMQPNDSIFSNADPDYLSKVGVKTDKVEQLVLIGTGTSTSIPCIGCLIKISIGDEKRCNVCHDAADKTKWSKNKRFNTSAVIRYRHSDGTLHSILIDCGKVPSLILYRIMLDRHFTHQPWNGWLNIKSGNWTGFFLRMVMLMPFWVLTICDIGLAMLLSSLPSQFI